MLGEVADPLYEYAYLAPLRAVGKRVAGARLYVVMLPRKTTSPGT